MECTILEPMLPRGTVAWLRMFNEIADFLLELILNVGIPSPDALEKQRRARLVAGGLALAVVVLVFAVERTCPLCGDNCPDQMMPNLFAAVVRLRRHWAAAAETVSRLA